MVATRRRSGKTEEPNGDNENGGGKGKAEYEESRAQRIKENMERLKSLGILNLSKILKPEPNKRQTAKTPKPTHDTPRRRSTRLQEMPRVSYSEKKNNTVSVIGKKDEIPLENVEIHIDEGKNPETYTEEHENLLGECKRPWTLFVDGYDEEGERTYDPFQGKSCHQCRQKTLGLRTECNKCKIGAGQFCGDCLYTRYGENVTEVNENPNWICPVCRGICNCSRCRREKGWFPTGNIYRKVKRLGFRSVAHYLIQTFLKKTNLEEPAGEILVSSADEKDGMEDMDGDQDSDEDYNGGDQSEEDDDNVGT